jgi:two-component system phosphate regulon sensor histidine kinase PhoR
MNNLIGNAIRYTPDGGEISIGWRLRDSDGCAEFEVRDTGIGIAREHLPRLSERFYRVDSSRSRDTGGTGLGLAIVKHVVQRHGGELVVQSEAGKGSSFKLVFPAARVRRAAGGAARPADAVVASGIEA